MLPPVERMNTELTAFVLQAVGRLSLYLCAFMLIGITVFYTRVFVPVARANGSLVRREIEPALGRAGLIVAATLAGVCVVRLLAQTYAVFGVDEEMTFESVGIVALQTPWGLGWRFQFAAGFAALGAFVWVRLRPRVGWYVAVGAALFVGATIPLTGHAMAQPAGRLIAVTLQTAHILGGAVWIGTLVIVYTVGLGVAGSGDRGARWDADLINAFSPLALAAVGFLLMAGVMSAFVFLDSWNQLFHTAYGRTLLSKVVFFAGTGAFGAYNWRVLRPRLGKAGNEKAIRRSIAVELAVALVVLGVTAVLVALPLEH